MKAKIVTGHGAVIHYEARTPKIRVLPVAITTPRRGVDYWTEADKAEIIATTMLAVENDLGLSVVDGLLNTTFEEAET